MPSGPPWSLQLIPDLERGSSPSPRRPGFLSSRQQRSRAQHHRLGEPRSSQGGSVMSADVSRSPPVLITATEIAACRLSSCVSNPPLLAGGRHGSSVSGDHTTGSGPLTQKTTEGRRIREPFTCRSRSRTILSLILFLWFTDSGEPNGRVGSASFLLIENGVCNRQRPVPCKEMSTHREEQLKIRAPYHPMPALSPGPLEPSGAVVGWLG